MGNSAVKQSTNSTQTTPPNRENLYSTRGEASKFEGGRYGNKYNITNHSYPADLMAADGRYGGNYVVFYINVATDSKLFRDKKVETVEDYSPRDRGDLIAQNLTKGKLLAANTIGIAGGAVLGKALGLGTATGAGAVLAEVGAVAVAKTAASASRSQRRLKTAIALHVPNQLSIRYGVSWADDDTSALAMIAAGGEEIMKALQTKGKNSDVTGVAGSIISNLALSKGPFAAANSAATGMAANPKREQIFKGVDFRTFQFEYQFFPRNEAEAKNVLRIIEEFKYHMHPEFKDTNNFVYIYPSEFDISYYQGGLENRNLHRHTSCVLTEVNVNYTPNGVFNTFANGMPTQINITLGFRELALLTKDKIKDGL